MPAFEIVEIDAVDQEPFPESGIDHRKLTATLGCTSMRINEVTLEPGESTAAHAHERQEEIYLALDGGTLVIDGRDHDVAPRTLARVGPEPMRSVRNDSKTPQSWLMFGAPPVGTIDDFGEYVVPPE